MGEVKNFKKAGDTAKQVAQASKNPGAALKLGKALFDDKNSKISNSNAVLMFVFALFFDVLASLGLIPFVGWILGPIIYFLSLGIFWLWFKLVNVNYFNSRATASKVITAILELIPEISAVIPGIAINVAVAIAFVRIGEAGTASSQQSPETVSEKEDNVVNFRRGVPKRLPEATTPKEGIKTPARVAQKLAA